MKILGRIWDEIMTPDSSRAPSRAYTRAVIAVGHAMVGATIAGLVGLYGLAAACFVAAAYWLIKERSDMRRGGTFWDGLEDTVMVSLGLWYGQPWWPALMLICAAYIMAVAGWRK